MRLLIKTVVCLFIAMVILTMPVRAGGRKWMRDAVEASMQVTGDIVISPEGRMQSYTLDDPDALPPDVRKLIGLYLPSSQFEVTTASGKREAVEAKMTLQLLTKQDDNGGATIEIASSMFIDPDTPVVVKAAGERSLTPPRYPKDALMAGYSGTVHVVVDVTPDGNVRAAHVEQVDMTVLAREGDLRHYGNSLAKAALEVARKWKFSVDNDATDPSSSNYVRVPVDFTLRSKGSDLKYGQWRAYIRGEYKPIPWGVDKRIAARDLGAMSPGVIYPMESNISIVDPPPGS